MVFTVKPLGMLPSQGSFEGKVKIVAVRASLKADSPDDLAVSTTRMVLQEEIVLEECKIAGIPR
jgi:hypothetical protein